MTSHAAYFIVPLHFIDVYQNSSNKMAARDRGKAQKWLNAASGQRSSGIGGFNEVEIGRTKLATFFNKNFVRRICARELDRNQKSFKKLELLPVLETRDHPLSGFPNTSIGTQHQICDLKGSGTEGSEYNCERKGGETAHRMGALSAVNFVNNRAGVCENETVAAGQRITAIRSPRAQGEEMATFRRVTDKSSCDRRESGISFNGTLNGDKEQEPVWAISPLAQSNMSSRGKKKLRVGCRELESMSGCGGGKEERERKYDGMAARVLVGHQSAQGK
ncbi:hypothetical protein B0H13DRAFT_1896688 [Mycena leptocephala]|nr:hypothetical protein B0H13DRAFT_1896688 [Mycena leptocephala]